MSKITITVEFDDEKLRDFVLSLYGGPEFDDPAPEDPLEIIDGWIAETRERGCVDLAWMEGEYVKSLTIEETREDLPATKGTAA